METETKVKSGKVIFKKCHMCGHLMESAYELEKCKKCKKCFLPSNYFGKVHAKNSEEFKKLFSNSDELREEDLIKGVTTLW